MKHLLLSLTLLSATAWPVLAAPPKIENVKVSGSGGTFRFDVTILHPDTGWDHYADAWRILDMSGNQIAIRELAHPHTEEQPFTRSLSNVKVPEGTTQVQIQARDLPGGWNNETVTVTIP